MNRTLQDESRRIKMNRTLQDESRRIKMNRTLQDESRLIRTIWLAALPVACPLLPGSLGKCAQIRTDLHLIRGLNGSEPVDAEISQKHPRSPPPWRSNGAARETNESGFDRIAHATIH